MKIEPTAQGIALGMIVLTLCLAFLAALGLGSPLGVKLEPNAAAATITLFVGLVGAATGWFFSQRDMKQREGMAFNAGYEKKEIEYQRAALYAMPKKTWTRGEVTSNLSVGGQDNESKTTTD